FQTSVSNLNYKAKVTSSQGESESSITGFSQNFGVIYSFVEGQQLSFGSSYVNSESKVRSKRTSADIRTDVTGLGNLDLAYQGASELEYADMFYGLSYNFKHQGKVIREAGVNQFEANAVQAQNSWTPSIGIAMPTAINLTLGGDVSHTIKEDGDVRQELASRESTTTKERQGNVTSIMGFLELDIEYLPFISLRRTHYSEQVSETTASTLRSSGDAFEADTVTVGATLPLSQNLRIEPRFSHTKYTYDDSSDFSISDAEQTSLNVGLTLMF
ncbi:MAG: hypothetical protein ACK5P5_08575, partial [Pseudobdellovibrionaceae bacterium]